MLGVHTLPSLIILLSGQTNYKAPTRGTGAEAFIELWNWLLSFGHIASVGIEGTGSYGAGVARCLASQGAVVNEVNRPNRQLRRQRGKNDAVDAEAAARAVLAGHAGAKSKSHDGIVESIRLYRLMLTTFRKEHTALINTLRNVLISGPDELRDSWSHHRRGPCSKNVHAFAPPPNLSIAQTRSPASPCERWHARFWNSTSS